MTRERSLAELPDRLLHQSTVDFVRHLRPGKGEDGKLFREFLFLEEVEEGGKQLSFAQVACPSKMTSVNGSTSIEGRGMSQVCRKRLGNRYRHNPFAYASFLTGWPPNSFRKAATTLALNDSC